MSLGFISVPISRRWVLRFGLLDIARVLGSLGHVHSFFFLYECLNVLLSRSFLPSLKFVVLSLNLLSEFTPQV